MVPPCPATVGRQEAGQLGHGQLVRGRTDHVGGRSPAGAEHDGHVVPVDSGALGDGRGGRGGVGRAVVDGDHAAEPTTAGTGSTPGHRGRAIRRSRAWHRDGCGLLSADCSARSGRRGRHRGGDRHRAPRRLADRRPGDRPAGRDAGQHHRRAGDHQPGRHPAAGGPGRRRLSGRVPRRRRPQVRTAAGPGPRPAVRPGWPAGCRPGGPARGAAGERRAEGSGPGAGASGAGAAGGPGRDAGARSRRADPPGSDRRSRTRPAVARSTRCRAVVVGSLREARRRRSAGSMPARREAVPAARGESPAEPAGPLLTSDGGPVSVGDGRAAAAGRRSAAAPPPPVGGTGDRRGHRRARPASPGRPGRPGRGSAGAAGGAPRPAPSAGPGPSPSARRSRRPPAR